MKKLAMVAVVAFAVALCFTAHTAAAKEVSAQKIQQQIEQNTNIKECVVITVGSSCVVGIVTREVFSKTQYTLLVEEVKTVAQSFGCSDVFVTTKAKEVVFLKKAKQRLDSGDNPVEIYQEFLKKFPF